MRTLVPQKGREAKHRWCHFTMASPWEDVSLVNKQILQINSNSCTSIDLSKYYLDLIRHLIETLPTWSITPTPWYNTEHITQCGYSWFFSEQNHSPLDFITWAELKMGHKSQRKCQLLGISGDLSSFLAFSFLPGEAYTHKVCCVFWKHLSEYDIAEKTFTFFTWAI